MEIIFTIALAVFAITFVLALLGWSKVLTYPRKPSALIANGLILSIIALGIFAAAKFAPAIWDKF